MNFMKKIFDKKLDDSDSALHRQFQKFSKGEFRNRAMIVARYSKGKYTIGTTAEFANDLVRIVAEKLGSSKTQVNGAIVSTKDLTGIIEFKEKKQFQGVKRYIIDGQISGDDIVKLLDEFPNAFFALSFTAGDTILKIKPKSPKSGKPSTKDNDKLKADFCKLITTDKELGSSFVFEKPEFARAEIQHTYFVDDIIISEELKKEKDFAKARELAKRKGRIVREGKIDDEPFKSEAEFEV